jgi:hypothetical protein
MRCLIERKITTASQQFLIRFCRKLKRRHKKSSAFQMETKLQQKEL